MAFTNFIRMLTEPAPNQTDDGGLWLSLHTAYPPTRTNELTAANVGYGRKKIDATLGPDTGITSTVEYPMLWHTTGTTAAMLATAGSWTAGSAWPAVAAVALNFGTDARITRSGNSFIVADVELAAPWTLAQGASGIPPDNLSKWGIAIPDIADGGMASFGLSPPRIVPLMQQLITGTGFYKAGTDTDLPDTGLFGRRRWTAGEDATRGIGQVPLHLAFYDGQVALTAGVQTRRVAGFRTGRYWPVMEANAAGTALLNRDDISLDVTAGVSTGAVGYIGLEWDGAAVFASGSVTYSATTFQPVWFTRARTTNPALATNEGIIPARSLEVRV